MAWIDSDDAFNADAMIEPVVGIASRLVRHDSGWHQHEKGQLLFAKSGTMRITLDAGMSVLPPQRLAWIPPFCRHRVVLNEVVGYRSIYLDTNVFAHLPNEHMIWAMTPLLQAILENIALSAWSCDWFNDTRQAHWLNVLWDELVFAKQDKILLPLPDDYRLQKISWLILPPLLKDLANQVGASEKTITRVFKQQTGMGYQAWRQQWRLLKAIELLYANRPLMEIADILGFTNDSAFAVFFKNMTGQTTMQYIG